MHPHTGSSLGACSPPALARSRGAWGSDAETHTSCCPPPQHCTGGVARPTRRDSRREVTTLTSLREQAQPSASLVLLCRGGHTAEQSPAPALSTDVGGAGDAASPCTYRSRERGALEPPQGLCRSPHKLPARALHSGTTRGGWKQCRGAGPAPSWLPAPPGWSGDSAGGRHRGALRAAPAALLRSRAGGQLCTGRGCARASTELHGHGEQRAVPG